MTNGIGDQIENMGVNTVARMKIAKRYFTLKNHNGCHPDWDGLCKKHDIRRCQACTAKAWDAIDDLEGEVYEQRV